MIETGNIPCNSDAFPVDPTVVSGADITSTVTLYKSNDGSSRDLIRYSTSDNILLGNTSDDSNINLPSGSKFVPSNVLVCCGSSFFIPKHWMFRFWFHSICKFSYFKSSGVDVATVGSTLSTKTAQAKEYLIQFNIAGVLNNIPKSAQT